MVRITNIKVMGRGPVALFDEEIGPLTLIYSLNEAGKTSIAEALISSLFKPSCFLRTDNFQGGACEITVEGIKEKPMIFTPSSKKKLEDYFRKWDEYLPGSLARLLYVRAAKADFSSGGSSRWEDLRQLLSGEKILDGIERNLPKERKYACVENGIITGQRRARSKRVQKELYPALDEVDKFYEEMQALSSGELKSLQKEAEKKRERLDKLEQARRYEAFRIGRRLEELEKSSRALDSEKVDYISEKVMRLKQLHKSIEDKKAEIGLLEKDLTGFSWLKSAKEIYLREKLKKKKKYLYLPMLFLAVAFAGSAAGIMQIAIISIALTFLSFVYFLINPAELSGSILFELKKDYRERYGEKISITSIDSKIKEYEIKDNKLRELEGQYAADKDEAAGLTEQLNLKFEAAGIEKSDIQSAWKEIKRKHDEIDMEKASALSRLETLDVKPADYVEENPGIKYSYEEEKTLSLEIDSLRQKIGKIKEKMENEKSRLESFLNVSGRGYTQGHLMEMLKEKEDEIISEIKGFTAELAASAVLEEVLGELRDRQRKAVLERLNNPSISRYLKKITSVYSSLGEIGGRIVVFSDENGAPPYYLDNMSTGAKQQVLMALRCTLAAQISPRPMFFILDDAFQYSDWERRPEMVEMSVSLVRQGWQVIYFTMDNHIRDLFLEMGKGIEGGFSFIKL